MRALITDFEGGIELVEGESTPVCKENSRQVLVEVKAASINPIDARLANGDGASLMRLAGGKRILGRDCCGIVKEIGSKVTSVAVGDRVWCVTLNGGSMADFVIVNEKELTLAPSTDKLSDIEAAAMPFALMTAFACLASARINEGNARTKTVLVHGGAGGVGSVLLQILRAWNTKLVISTASRPESLQLLQDFGATAIDYRSPEVFAKLATFGPYDAIIACAKSDLVDKSYTLLHKCSFCPFVSLDSPLLDDTRRFGVIIGLLVVAAKFIGRWLKLFFTGGRLLKWAIAQPNKSYLKMGKQLIDADRIRVIVHKSVRMEEGPEEIMEILRQKTIGKIVVEM